jgi:hypothetical protein
MTYAQSHGRQKAKPPTIAALDAETIELEGPAMSCGLGILVNARGLLHQSEPSIEGFHVNTLGGRCKSNPLPGGQVRSSSPSRRSHRD